MMSLTKRVGQGALWQISGGSIGSFIRLAASAVLARLLNPIDFGILGIGILALNGIAYLGNLGIGAGIISKQDINSDDLNTGFWIMVANRILLFIFAYFLAPIIALFFNEPKVTEVFRVICFVFLLSAIDAIPRSILTKEMRYGSLTIVKIIGAVVESSVAILLAVFTDLRYWCLIIGMLSSYVCSLVILVIFAQWYPQLIWSKNSYQYFKKFIIYGFNSSIVVYLKENIDYILVGRILGTKSLGLYEYAYKIPHTFTNNFMLPVTSILHPLLSKLQDNKEVAGEGYLKAIQLIALVSFPTLVGLAATADVVVPVLWGEKWISIISPLKILCFAALLQLINQMNNSLFLANQRPDLVFKSNLAGLGLTFFFVTLLGYFFRINGVALGMLIGNIPCMYFFYISCRLINISTIKAINKLLGILFSATICFFASFFSIKIMLHYNMNTAIVFFLSILCGGIAYIVSVFMLDKSVIDNTINLLQETTGLKIKLPFIS